MTPDESLADLRVLFDRTRSHGFGVVAPGGRLTGVRTLSLSVDTGSPVDGVLVREVDWPGRTLVTSIRRGSEVLVPDGSTRLGAGDEIMVVADPGEVETVRALLVREGAPIGDTSPDPSD